MQSATAHPPPGLVWEEEEHGGVRPGVLVVRALSEVACLRKHLTRSPGRRLALKTSEHDIILMHSLNLFFYYTVIK